MEGTKRFALYLLLLALIGCTQSGPSVKSSGDQGFDQTAEYALHTIQILKKRSHLDSPSKIVEYMFSTMGSAELTPPNENTEPGMASAYKGPRPANDIWLQSSDKEANEFFKKHLMLTPDDGRNVIIAEGYRENDDDPFFTWEWSLD